MAKTQVRMPLFDRLVDHDPQLRREGRPLRTLTRSDLRESIRRELTHLLSTRVQLPQRQLESRQRTVIDYGVPDFGSFSAKNPNHRQSLAEILARTIEIYEPRLCDVRVHLDVSPKSADALVGRIEANLVVESVREPVSFTTVLDDKEGTVTLDGGA